MSMTWQIYLIIAFLVFVVSMFLTGIHFYERMYAAEDDRKFKQHMLTLIGPLCFLSALAWFFMVPLLLFFLLGYGLIVGMIYLVKLFKVKKKKY